MAYEVLTGNGAAGVYDGTEPRVGLQSMNKIRNSLISHESRLVIAENYIDNLPSTVVGTTDTQTLTNKTISLTGNTITGALPLANLPTNVAPIFRAVAGPFTDAQLKALPTTALDVVAAPGAGFYLVPLYAELRTKFSGGAYTNIHASATAHLVWTSNNDLWSDYIANDATETPAITELSDIFGTAQEFRTPLTQWKDNRDGSNVWGSLATRMSLQENSGLKLSFNNQGAGNLTGGNAANTATVLVVYMKEAV